MVHSSKTGRLSISLVIISDFVNAFHIYGFTFISGFLFYYLKIEKIKYEDFVLFSKNKAKRLLAPYVFVCTVWVAPITTILAVLAQEPALV